jgi:hypothetical protein
MCAMVLLRHDLPDGTHHFDWMIQARAGSLVTFRVTSRLDHLSAGLFLAQRLPNHRDEYLTREGEVSGGRGTVTRMASGYVTTWQESRGQIHLHAERGWGRGAWSVQGHADTEPPGWVFHILTLPPP